jgi:hypothetical protein
VHTPASRTRTGDLRRFDEVTVINSTALAAQPPNPSRYTGTGTGATRRTSRNSRNGCPTNNAEASELTSTETGRRCHRDAPGRRWALVDRANSGAPRPPALLPRHHTAADTNPATARHHATWGGRHPASGAARHLSSRWAGMGSSGARRAVRLGVRRRGAAVPDRRRAGRRPAGRRADRRADRRRGYRLPSAPNTICGRRRPAPVRYRLVAGPGAGSRTTVDLPRTGAARLQATTWCLGMTSPRREISKSRTSPRLSRPSRHGPGSGSGRRCQYSLGGMPLPWYATGGKRTSGQQAAQLTAVTPAPPAVEGGRPMRANRGSHRDDGTGEMPERRRRRLTWSRKHP